jgi:alkaline phosphatase D
MQRFNARMVKFWKIIVFPAIILLVTIAMMNTSFALVSQTDGPLVGGVTETSAKIFARTNGSANVAVEYSKDISLASSIQTTTVKPSRRTDWTTIALVEGLEPQTKYYYTVLVNGFRQQNAPYPSFTTFPLTGLSINFSFTVLADLINLQNFPGHPAPVYSQVMKENPAFVLQIGDFDHRNPKTLEAMREMHREVRGGLVTTASGNDFSNYIGSRFPLFHIWDDHDYGKNNGDKKFYAKALALRAFKEYYPTPDLANPNAGIWHKFSYGQADFFMIDVRSQRDPNSDPDGQDKSLLDGDRISSGQKEWLKEGLLNSPALWKFIISGVAFNPTCKPLDSWGAFNTERNEILDLIRENSIQGVIVISGDLHSGGGIDNGKNAGVPEITVPATNMTGYNPTGPVGVWSNGVFRPKAGGDGDGYALITVLTNPDRVILKAKGVNGESRKMLLIDSPESCNEHKWQ